ncbi:MAG: beta-CASP ribonuclease aCPSF1 [Candidatus Helarchaeota archaeon]
MFSDEILDEIRQSILKKVHPDSGITTIEFEGPEIAIYSKNPRVLIDYKDSVKELAKKIRKRLVIRSDPTVRLPEDEARKIIANLCPEKAGVTTIDFDENLGEVIIEAKKPGLVIGKNGATLKEITKSVLWRPNVIRTPPLKSKMVSGIREALKKGSIERKKILKNVGTRIHRYTFLNNNQNFYIRMITFGGFREVGRSCFLIQTPESNVLMDCGINIGGNYNTFPQIDLPEFNIEELDAVIISHSHLDHHGFLPFLFKYGFRGPVYCTHATRNLMTLLQLDYLDVAKREGKFLPYDQKDVKKMVLHTIPLEYGEVTDIAPDIRLTLHNAGHILGSSIIHLHINDGMYNLAYTGDFKFTKTRLLEPAHFNFPRLETLIIESTYGGNTDVMPSRREAERQLVTGINRTLNRGGKVLIPVLAVGRAQELIITLEEFMRRGILRETPVYIDGLISEATAIHTTHPEDLARDLRDMIFHQGHNPFLSEYFQQVDTSSSRQNIVEGEPCIILATSGMLNGGPSLEYLKMLAEDPANYLLFVSYQIEGTLGRRIQKGWRDIPVKEANGRSRVVHIKLEIAINEGFSGHSSRQQLLEYIRKVRPKPERIITNHGEEAKCLSLASAIHKITRAETRAPQNMESLRLK